MHPYRKMIDMPKEILHTMGKRLKMLRDNAEMDQRQFAHAVSQRGVSVTNSFVSKMESGDSKPSIDVLVAIADELAVSADYLLMRTNIPDTAESILAEIERQQGGVDDTGRGVTEEAAAAAKQRGSRAAMLAEVAAGGPAMLTAEDTAAANAWLRRRVRVFVADNQVTRVRFDFW